MRLLYRGVGEAYTDAMKNDQKSYCYARIIADTNLYRVQIDPQDFHYGKQVVIRSEFGLDLGFITSFPFKEKSGDEKFYDAGKLVRYATLEDLELSAQRLKTSRSLRIQVIKHSQELKLQMNVTHLLLPLEGNTIVIYYTANGRIDFRELLKRLRMEMKEKITMRQIANRERFNSFCMDQRNPF